MRTLSLDVATVIGLTRWEGFGLPTTRRIDLVQVARDLQILSKSKDFDVGHMVYAAWREIDSEIRSFRPDLIAMEAPILRKLTTVSTTRKLQGVAAVIEMLGVKHKIPVYEIETTAVKLELSGFGFATKDEQVAAAQAMGFNIDDDNVADSLGIHGCVLAQMFPDEHMLWKARQDNDAWRRNMANARAAFTVRRRENAEKKAAKEGAKPKTVKRAPAKNQQGSLL